MRWASVSMRSTGSVSIACLHRRHEASVVHGVGEVVAAAAARVSSPSTRSTTNDLPVAPLEVEDAVVARRLDAAARRAGRWSSVVLSASRQYRGGMVDPQPPAVGCAANTLVATAFAAGERACSGASSSAGEDVLGAGDGGDVVSTRTWTSVRKNWMYGVLAMIIAQDRSSPRCRGSRRAPGWTHTGSGSSSQSAAHQVQVAGLERRRRTRRWPPRPPPRLAARSRPAPAAVPAPPRRDPDRVRRRRARRAPGRTRPPRRRRARTGPWSRPRASGRPRLTVGVGEQPPEERSCGSIRPAPGGRGRAGVPARASSCQLCSRGLREPEPGVDRDPVPVDAGGEGCLDPRGQLRRSPRRPRRRTPRASAWSSACARQCIRTYGDAAGGDDVGSIVGVGQPAGDVVDQHGAGLDGRVGDLGAHGVDGDQRRRRRRAPRSTGSTRSSSSATAGRARPGPGRLATDVDAGRHLRRAGPGRARPPRPARARGRRRRTSRGSR